MFFRLPGATLGAVVFATIAFVLTLTGGLPAMAIDVTDRFSDLNQGGTRCSVWCCLFSLAGFIAGATLQGFAERLAIYKGAGCFLGGNKK